MTVIEEIAIERERQKTVEGWTEAHDDAHTDGSLALAGAAYAVSSTEHKDLWRPRQVDVSATVGGSRFNVGWVWLRSLIWPASWERASFKPTNARRDLVKAAALLVAEIERIDRRQYNSPDY